MDARLAQRLQFLANNPPKRLAFSPDGATLAVAHDRPALVNLWAVEDGERRATVELPDVTAPAEDLAFGADGRLLVRAGDRLLILGP